MEQIADWIICEDLAIHRCNPMWINRHMREKCEWDSAIQSTAIGKKTIHYEKCRMQYVTMDWGSEITPKWFVHIFDIYWFPLHERNETDDIEPFIPSNDLLWKLVLCFLIDFWHAWDGTRWTHMIRSQSFQPHPMVNNVESVYLHIYAYLVIPPTGMNSYININSTQMCVFIWLIRNSNENWIVP